MRRIPSFLALRAFESAARLGSFARASEELHLTPSAISHQVKALEQHFGRPLFVRLSRQVELTAEGDHLLGSLTPAFDSIEAACTEIGRTQNEEVLALHCAPSFASKWLGPKLPSFLNGHPGINLRLSASAEPIDLTRHEDLDLVIAYGSAPSRRGVVAEPLGVEIVTALAAPRLATACERAGDLSLDGVALIESAVSPVRWSDWCGLNGLPPPSSGSRPSFDRGALAVSAAVQGLGIALESTRFAHDELAKGELVAFGGSRWRGVPRVLHFLCYRSAQRDLGKIAAFRSWLLQAASEDQSPELAARPNLTSDRMRSR